MRHEHVQANSEEPLTSIFFGGGTPSLMPPSLVAELIAEADRLWGFDPAVEITLEANPSSVEAANFANLAMAGVNRVSLGVQSLHDEALRFLGRLHGASEALQALEVAQRHFKRVSIDLIYARPGQTEADWHAELGRALALGTDHCERMIDLVCSTLDKPFAPETCAHFKREAFHAILDEEQRTGRCALRLIDEIRAEIVARMP